MTYNSKKKLLNKQGEDDENIYDAPQLGFGKKEEAVNDMGKYFNSLMHSVPKWSDAL